MGRAKVNLRNFDMSNPGPRTVREKHIASLIKISSSPKAISALMLIPDLVKSLVSNFVLEQTLSRVLT
jgi:hypothetical protein